MTRDNVVLSFQARSTNASVPLGLRVQLDNVTIYETNHVTDTVDIKHEMSDSDGEHVLTMELFGKQAEHTKIDQAGNILSDAMLEIDSFNIDEIDLDHIMQTLAVYHHDTNGTQSAKDHKFFGTLGCNGTVILKFDTPVYLWLLENM